MSFSLDLNAFIEKAKANADLVVKKVSIDMLNKIVDRSPVGNPELWAANKAAVYARETHNLFVGAINADIKSNPANYTKKGNLKSTVRLAREKSQRALKKEFPLTSGKNYVGGRFRGNWQVSFNVAKTGELERVDQQGNETKQEGLAVIQTFNSEVGSIWLMNNVPYAQPLEYGHSSQAPAGMVRVTVAEFQSFVNRAVQELPD
ncbi:hypothetical protein ACKI1H_26990 [Pseudomonas sp. YH-1]|uniref:hypothetical protein n=1 Tax=Pseudomonas sp. YH-1 TaxID=3384787 RepID=UPI003F7E77DE